jgi:hypothetical protein
VAHDLAALPLIGNQAEQFQISADILLIEEAFQVHSALKGTTKRRWTLSVNRTELL